MTEQVHVLSIGSVEGGWSPGSARWRDGITKLTRKVAAARQGVVSPLNVNVVFHVPGNILTPDFDGVRTGHFSNKQAWLIVQVALHEQPPDDVDVDLMVRLQAAIDEATQWAQKRRIADNLPQLRALVRSL